MRALRAWLQQAGIMDGPLFRAVDQCGLVGKRALHADSIAYLVKRAVGRAGLEIGDDNLSPESESVNDNVSVPR